LAGDEKTAKYVNSGQETPNFHQEQGFLQASYKSKRALLDAQSAIVCEASLT